MNRLIINSKAIKIAGTAEANTGNSISICSRGILNLNFHFAGLPLPEQLHKG